MEMIIKWKENESENKVEESSSTTMKYEVQKKRKEKKRKEKKRKGRKNCS